MISLISFSPEGIGIRGISSYLKSKGHETQMLFFPEYEYININEKVLNNILLLVKDSDFIAFSITCMDYPHALKIAKFIKKNTKIPVIFGGPEAIANPEKYINYVDVVCTGEGEEPMLKLVETKGKKYDIKDLWFNVNGKIIKNSFMELEQNLNKYPFPDYSFSHYIYDKNLRIFRKMIIDDFKNYIFKNSKSHYGQYYVYNMISSRGCPFRCTYCNNNILGKRYKGKYLRMRSINNVITEIEHIKKMFDFINYITFVDDNFVSRTTDKIVEFSELYKERVNLPFNIRAAPLSINEDKLVSLLDCGLTSMTIGVQTGSDRVLKEIYKRPTNNEIILRVSDLVYKNRKKFKFLCRYDLILDNPFENIDDNIMTMRLMTEIKGNFEINHHSLRFYDGTEIYEMAKKAGFLKEIKERYNKSLKTANFDYVRFFCTAYPLLPFKLPRKIINFLLSKKTVIYLQNKRFNGFFKTLTILTIFIKHLILFLRFRIFKLEIKGIFKELYLQLNTWRKRTFA